MKTIPKILLSGGPGGGKSHALGFLKKALTEFGYTVYLVEESATKVLERGFDRSCPALEFQTEIARLQLKMEAEVDSIEDDGRSVIICDRGLMDCRVYLDDDDFEAIKQELKLSDIDMRDRYDAVFHLDSTSTNKDVNYHTGEIRIENRQEAKSINERSLRAWCGNPHYRFIPVCDTIDEKLNRLLSEVKAFLGIPKPLEIERKFLIKYPDLDYLGKLVCRMAEIEQTYLVDQNGKYRLRKRGEGDSVIYIRTEKKKITETVREEVETRLTEAEYNEQLNNGLKLGSISKKRYCVMYGGVYYEIDIFPFWKNQAFLEVELLSENDEVIIPEFIDVIKEVTSDSRYRNFAMCNSVPDEEH